MALVQNSMMLSQISGSIGGVVFRRNRYGLCACAKVNPVNTNTDRQSVARARLSSLSAMWNEVLTELQRTQWNNYGANVNFVNRIGQVIKLTGFNHFCRSNAAILAAGGVIVKDGPAVYTLPAQDNTLAVAISEATGKIAVTFDDTADWCSENGAYLSLQMGQPQNNNINFFGGPWQHVGSIAGNSVTPAESPDDLDISYPVQEGQLVWCRARIIRADGRTSGLFRASCEVEA